MRYVGRYSDNQYFMGFDSSGKPKVLFWVFAEDPRENPTATAGYWNLGDYIGDISAIQGEKSFTACPHDKMNEWGHFVQLKCGEAPQQPQVN